MPQHGPVQWQLGNRAAAAGPWRPDPRVLVGVAACCMYQTAQGVEMAVGGLPAPICVRPEFAIGNGRPMSRPAPGVHVLNY